jgi:hypothetical protein
LKQHASDKETDMTQLAHDHESSATRKKPRRLGMLLAASLLVAAGSLYGTVPALADDSGGSGNGGNGGSEGRGDGSSGDRDGIYEVQRGEPTCDPGACSTADQGVTGQLPLGHQAAPRRR